MIKYHYVYRITNLVLNKHYYGSRSSKIVPYLDLGIRYFSSSKDAEFLNDQRHNHHDYRYKIIKQFDNRQKAILYEIRLHYMFNVDKNPNFYNKAKQKTTGFYYSNAGCKFTKEHREKISAKSRNKSPETIEKIRKGVKTDLDSMSEDRRKLKCDAISLALKGKPQPKWKNEQHSKLMSGAGNSRAKTILIFDNHGELMHRCDGNFKKTCLDHKLPHTALRKSHISGGQPLCSTVRSKLEAEKRGWTQFAGWFAKEVVTDSLPT